MKLTNMMMKASFVLFTFGLAVAAYPKTVTIKSNTTWTVTDSNMSFLGNAQNVCANPTSPINCPAGATSYGYAGAAAWTATSPSVSGATWIWAPNIVGTTSPAANAEFFLKQIFFLCGPPQSGSISVAADDFAEVFINGATVPAVTSTSWAVVSTANVPASSLAQGLNTIVVHVRNGPNPSDCTSDQYRCNPAGVIIGASFSDALAVWPTCTDKGTTFNVGDTETLPCPPGKTGSMFQVCACIGSNSIWYGPLGSCTTPPPTCTGKNGTIFNLGQTETLPCPAGTTGSAVHTCQSNGWGPTNNTMCVPPPKTCTGSNGTVFSAGQIETLPCPVGQSASPPRSRTCQADGTWGPVSGLCQLPLVCAGCKCGSVTENLTGRCPSGTSCQHRALPTPPRPWYCAVFGIDCPVKMWTADWFCDPP